MKILYVISYFSPSFGGDVNVCSNLAKKLVNVGHHVTILTTDFGFDENFSDSLYPVEIIPLPSKFNWGLFIYTPDLHKWIKKHLSYFDIIHFHNFRSYQNYPLAKHAVQTGIPYVIQAHGSTLRRIDKYLLKSIYDIVWGNFFIRNTNLAIALNEEERQQYLKAGLNDQNISIIPNGVDLSEFELLPKQGIFKNKFNLNEYKMLLYVGRIHKSKGLDLLINAYNNILKRFGSPIKLVIIGPDHGYLQELMELINQYNLLEHVLIPGPLYGLDKIAAYVDADIFLLPSLSEGFPITVLEAIACETPVIVTDTCGISDIVDGQIGFVVQRDILQMTESILELLDNPNLQQQFINNGKDLISNKYNLNIISKNLLIEYQNVTGLNDEKTI